MRPWRVGSERGRSAKRAGGVEGLNESTASWRASIAWRSLRLRSWRGFDFVAVPFPLDLDDDGRGRARADSIALVRRKPASELFFSGQVKLRRFVRYAR